MAYAYGELWMVRQVRSPLVVMLQPWMLLVKESAQNIVGQRALTLALASCALR